jgi:hypothetical protein
MKQVEPPTDRRILPEGESTRRRLRGELVIDYLVYL